MKQLLLLGLLLVVGCRQKIDGTLEVLQTFLLKGEAQSITLTPGAKSATLTVGSRREVKFEVQEGAQKIAATFKVPSGTKVPDENGSFALHGAEIGQNFDIHGVVRTTRTRKSLRRDFEQCTATRTRTDCYSVGNPPRTECRQVTETYPGRREVEYYEVEALRDLTMQINSPNSSLLLGKFLAQDTWLEREYLYQGQCW